MRLGLFTGLRIYFFTLYVETRAYTTIEPFRQKNSNIKYKHEPAPQVLECVAV